MKRREKRSVVTNTKLKTICVSSNIILKIMSSKKGSVLMCVHVYMNSLKEIEKQN